MVGKSPLLAVMEMVALQDACREATAVAFSVGALPPYIPYTGPEEPLPRNDELDALQAAAVGLGAYNKRA